MNLRNFKTQIIAEIAQSHKGSINLAKKMIDLSSQAGADYVKFQAHYSNYESTFDEKFRKGFNFIEKNGEVGDLNTIENSTSYSIDENNRIMNI